MIEHFSPIFRDTLHCLISCKWTYEILNGLRQPVVVYCFSKNSVFSERKSARSRSNKWHGTRLHGSYKGDSSVTIWIIKMYMNVWEEELATFILFCLHKVEHASDVRVFLIWYSKSKRSCLKFLKMRDA